jgi:hypothetical protein
MYQVVEPCEGGEIVWISRPLLISALDSLNAHLVALALEGFAIKRPGVLTWRAVRGTEVIDLIVRKGART